MAKNIIQFMAIDAKEPRSPVSGRPASGNNRYSVSNWHQWANSDAVGGSWYSPQHPYDEPPSDRYVDKAELAYDWMDGFLRMLPDEFVNAIIPTSVQTQAPDADSKNAVDTITAKIFLPSATEMGWKEVSGSLPIGVKLPIMDMYEPFRMAFPTTAAAKRRDPEQSGGEYIAHTGIARSALSMSSTSLRSIQANGIGSSALANWAYGVRPVMNLPSSFPITSIPTREGHYRIALQSEECVDFDVAGKALASRPSEACFLLTHVDGKPESTTVLLCNNMLDASPVWETCTLGTPHRFANRAKASVAWAVGARVRLSLDGSLGLRMKAPIILVKCE